MLADQSHFWARKPWKSHPVLIQRFAAWAWSLMAGISETRPCWNAGLSPPHPGGFRGPLSASLLWGTRRSQVGKQTCSGVQEKRKGRSPPHWPPPDTLEACGVRAPRPWAPGTRSLHTCCLLGHLLFGLAAPPRGLPAWVSNYQKDVSAKTYLTKNTALCVRRNPKPGRIF